MTSAAEPMAAAVVVPATGCTYSVQYFSEKVVSLLIVKHILRYIIKTGSASGNLARARPCDRSAARMFHRQVVGRAQIK
jgi:hypothetical protein